MRKKVFLRLAILSVLVGLSPTMIQGLARTAFWPLVTSPGILYAAAQEARCVEDWEQRLVIRAEGKAVAPFSLYPIRMQARLMAEEGAKAMAYADLCNCIVGVLSRSRIGTHNMIAQGQLVEKSCASGGLIQGARPVKVEVIEDAQAAMGLVTLELPLQGEGGLTGRLPPDWRPPPRQQQPREEPRPAPSGPQRTHAIDGLILDARGLSAFPVLYPEVMGEQGGVLYDWHRVDQEHRGLLGRVTNTVEKAKTLLKEQGSVNPLVVRVARMDGPTTYLMRTEEVRAVISADQDTQFLRKNRVIFVLGSQGPA